MVVGENMGSPRPLLIILLGHNPELRRFDEGYRFHANRLLQCAILFQPVVDFYKRDRAFGTAKVGRGKPGDNSGDRK